MIEMENDVAPVTIDTSFTTTTTFTETLKSNDNVEVTSNIAQVLSEVQASKSDTKPKRKKGRPVMHKFSGRITLLRDEVELALKDGPAFIEMMKEDHKLDAERITTLMANGELSDEFVEMYYTFQGEIQVVLDEIAATTSRWQKKAVEIRVDFKKKRITPDEEPIRNSEGLIEKVEVFPDRIYGYLKIVYKNPTFISAIPA